MRSSLLISLAGCCACAPARLPEPKPDPIHLAALERCDELQERERLLDERAAKALTTGRRESQLGRTLDGMVEPLWSAGYALDQVSARLEELEAAEQALTELARQARSARRSDEADVVDAVSIRITELRRALRDHQRTARSHLLTMEQGIARRRGPPARLAGQISGLREGCDGGHAPSCFWLGSAYEAGVGIAKDHEWAVTAYGAGCAAGDSTSCYHQGRLWLRGDLEQQPKAAFAALQQGCDGGAAGACALLAELAATGDGVEKELELAAELYQRACLGGELDACVSGGLLWRDGASGLPRNGEKAAFLLELGCDSGEPTACGYLGEIYLKGWGVPVDADRGAALMRRACAEGDFGACPR